MQLIGANTARLEKLAAELGEPAYRGRQLAEWIYRKGADSFDAMTSLPVGFRRRLNEAASIYRSSVTERTHSPDGTTKYLLELFDGLRIESVLIPSSDRVTVCVSSQVGCAAGCSFCASASGGLVRSLSAGEIVDQVLTIEREAGRRVTNVVYMGMGEPLLNYDEVLASLRLLNAEVGIAMRRMTVSTVGITPRILQLQRENLQITLAVSLHAPDDSLRRQLIPLARRYPMNGLLSACRSYAERTGRRVTYEYLLIDGVNDSEGQARKLAHLIAGSLANVNLIPYNCIPGKEYRRSPQDRLNTFRAILERSGIETTQRMERGRGVAAACGQLRSEAQGRVRTGTTLPLTAGTGRPRRRR